MRGALRVTAVLVAILFVFDDLRIRFQAELITTVVSLEPPLNHLSAVLEIHLSISDLFLLRVVATRCLRCIDQRVELFV